MLVLGRLFCTHSGYNRVHNSEISGDERRVCFGASFRGSREDRASFRRESHLGESVMSTGKEGTRRFG